MMQIRQATAQPLTEKQRIRKVYFHYLIPTIIGMVAHSCYCLADVFFVGSSVGSNGLAALNVALPIFTVYSTVSVLIGVGTATTISICRGEERYEEIDKVFTQSLVLTMTIGILFAIVGTIYLRQIAYLFGATDLIVDNVVAYLLPVSPAAFLYMMSSTLSIIVRSDGNPRLVMTAGITGNLINVVLDYVFVIRMGMGIFGAGLATIIGPCFTLGLLMLHFFKRHNQIYLTKHFISWSSTGRLIKNGVGSGVLEISSGFVILLFNITLLKVGGEDAVAIFSIISNIGYVGKGIFNGMAQAAQPVISVSYGAKEYSKMRVVNTYAMMTAFFFSIAVYGLILLFPNQLIGIFVSPSPAIVAIGKTAVILYFLSFPFTGLNTILMYYFQSIERVANTTIMAMMRGIVLVYIALLVFSRLWGINGVWLALFASELVTFIFFFPVKINVDKKFLPMK